MKKISLGLLALVGAFVAGSSVQGQEADSIVLGGILLRLGMSQNEVLAVLGPVYDLKAMEGTKSWLVSRRRNPMSFGDVGVISFLNQRLAHVSKQWGPNDPNGRQLGKALHDAVRSVTGGDSQTCQVRSRLVGIHTDVTIVCGGRTLSIMGGGDGNYSANVAESISNY